MTVLYLLTVLYTHGRYYHNPEEDAVERARLGLIDRIWP